MDAVEASEFLESMTDKHLVESLKIARDDLADASVDARNSEWHEACFAAFLTFSAEVIKRGIKIHMEH